MKRMGIILSVALCMNLTFFPANAEETAINKIDSAIFEHFASGYSRVQVGITFQDIDIAAIAEAVNAMTEEYRLTIDTTQYSAEEIEKQIVSYAKQTYTTSLNAAYKNRSAQIVTDLGLSEEQFAAYSGYTVTISAKLTLDQVEDAAAHPQVEMVTAAVNQETCWHDPVDGILPYSTGDPNGDGTVNALDAADILVLSARIGAGESSSVIEIVKNDVNGDGFVDAMDASDILIYASEVGASETKLRFPAYIYEKQGTVMRLALMNGSDSSTPVTKLLCSREELDTFAENELTGIDSVNATNGLTGSDPLDTQQVLASYDENFFISHDLVAVYIYERSNSIWNEVNAIDTRNGEEIIISIDRMVPDLLEMATGRWMILVEVDKSNALDRTVKLVTNEIHVPFT